MRTFQALILSLVLAAPAAAQCSDCVFPGEEWEIVRAQQLARYGWDRQALREVAEHLRDNSNSTGVMVVDKGRVVYRFGDTEELSYIASVRKSLLAMLYGYTSRTHPGLLCHAEIGLARHHHGRGCVRWKTTC